MQIKWKIIFRNSVIVIGTFLVSPVIVTLVIMLANAYSLVNLAIRGSQLGSKVLGFFISGCLTTRERWKYLFLTALSVWCFDIARFCFVTSPILSPTIGRENAFKFAIINALFELPITFATMLIGGSFSVLFKRDNSSLS